MAVFISYAREDSAAARRIAEALRSAGVEVWFDENELRGGDVWDARIRRQIDQCALFVPLISAHTQARAKGYFRLEWKLAVDQVHLLAEGTPFVTPVVVDATRENEARVPAEFLRYHWTRLAGGLPTPAFVAQVQHLLERRSGAPAAAGAVAASRPASAPRSGRRLGWVGAAAILAALVAGGFGLRLARRAAAPSPATAPAPAPAAAADEPPARSLAVLPFSNFSGDQQNAFFVDGLHDEVITALARVHDLKVISRTSVMAYRDPNGRNLRKIAGELNVAAVLEGSVQRSGTQVHLNVQLIDARTDQHVWAESYTRDVTDIFSAQAELAAAVTAALSGALSSSERTAIEHRPTENAQAYDLYLRGRVLEEELSPAADVGDYERALACYTAAAALDPAFNLPHVRASILHGTMYWLASLDATASRRAKALAELETARRLAPDAPETRLAEGSFEYACNTDWRRALARYAEAARGLPNDAQLVYLTALAHRRLGDWTQAIEALRHATELSPNDQFILQQFVTMLNVFGRYPEVLLYEERRGERFKGNHSLRSAWAVARCEVQGNAEILARFLDEDDPAVPDRQRLAERVRAAWIRGDLKAADVLLLDPRLDFFVTADGTIVEATALNRAMDAFLEQDTAAAGREAAAAIAWYRRREWQPRQQVWLDFEVARAEVYAGKRKEGLDAARRALEKVSARDAFSAGDMHLQYAHLLAAAGSRSQALAALRGAVRGPCAPGPVVLARHICWTAYRNDPEFRQILASMGPR